MTYLKPELQARIERKKRQLDRTRPLPESAVRKLREKMAIEMAYNSNAIEGNSLTLKETFLVVNEGITVKGKPLKDHLEAKDHFDALEYLYDLAGGPRQTISERLIRTLHQMVVRKTDEEWAGRYRNANVIIAGAEHTPPDASEVPALMGSLMTWLRDSRRQMHSVELAALLHHKLVNIHPFFDGNGRTARLTMNLLLMQERYPLVIILKQDRKKYYRVLERADSGDLEPLVRFITQAVESSLDMYLEAIGGVTGKDDRLEPLSVIAERTPYSAKYLNLLARTGRLEAHKRGRNWFTSKKAVERYMAGRERKGKQKG